jgi:hypothetical protein
MLAAVRRRWSADEVDQALSLAERYGIRAIANTITLYAWRNGPVEDVHAGWADGGACDSASVQGKPKAQTSLPTRENEE